MKRADAIKILERKKDEALAKRNEADLHIGEPEAWARYQLYAGQVEAYSNALALVRLIAPEPAPQRVKPVVVIPRDTNDWPF